MIVCDARHGHFKEYYFGPAHKASRQEVANATMDRAGYNVFMLTCKNVPIIHDRHYDGSVLRGAQELGQPRLKAKACLKASAKRLEACTSCFMGIPIEKSNIHGVYTCLICTSICHKLSPAHLPENRFRGRNTTYLQNSSHLKERSLHV